MYAFTEAVICTIMGTGNSRSEHPSLLQPYVTVAQLPTHDYILAALTYSHHRALYFFRQPYNSQMVRQGGASILTKNLVLTGSPDVRQLPSSGSG